MNRRLLLLGRRAKIGWLLRDEFSDTLAAGSVNGTLSDSGHVRTVVDTGGVLSINGGYLKLTNYAGTSDPRCRYGPFTRVAGTIAVWNDYKKADGYNRPGWYDVTPNALSHWYDYAGVLRFGATLVIGSISATYNDIVQILRANGSYLLQKTTGNYLLLYAGAEDSTSSLYVMGLISGNPCGAPQLGALRIPQALYLPVPLLSDGFGGTWPTSDGAGHAETTGLGSGGSGLTWAARLGTWGNAAGVASCSALDVSGIGIATATLNTADAWYSCVLGYSAGSAGVIVRYTDAANYVYAVNDGTNVKLFEVTTAVPYPGTERGTGIKAPAAGARLILDVSGAASRVYYNEALIFAYASIADTTGKTIGLITSNVNNTFNDAVAYAKGTGGEYAILDKYSRD